MGKMVWCRCEGCCSVLALELGAGFTLADYFFIGLVFCRVRRNLHMQATVTLLFPDGIDAVDVELSPFGRRNDECFTSQD